MKKPTRYQLSIWDISGNTEYVSQQSDAPFPRFEEGDHLDAGYFDQRTDSGSQFLVVRVEYIFSADNDFVWIDQSLRIRLAAHGETHRYTTLDS